MTGAAFAEIDSALTEMKAPMRKHRAWWALNQPVAYVWLCRAERRGAIVPWTER